MTDLEGLIKYHDETEENVVIPLLGRFKGEHHAKQHLLSSRAVTGSGIQVKQWIRRVLAVHRIHGRRVGPAFVNAEGFQSTTGEMNEMFIALLIEIHEVSPKLFPLDIDEPNDLYNKYNVFRSFRRGSESCAVAMNVSEADRYWVNRWKKKESAGGNKVLHKIDQMYVDMSLVRKAFLRYTEAM